MRNGVGKPRTCSWWWYVRLVGREGQSYHVTVFCVLDIGSLDSVLDSGHTDITLREAGVTPGSLLSVRRLSPEELGRVLLCCDQLATGLACATLVKKYNED